MNERSIIVVRMDDLCGAAVRWKSTTFQLSVRRSGMRRVLAGFLGVILMGLSIVWCGSVSGAYAAGAGHIVDIGAKMSIIGLRFVDKDDLEEVVEELDAAGCDIPVFDRVRAAIETLYRSRGFTGAAVEMEVVTRQTETTPDCHVTYRVELMRMGRVELVSDNPRVVELLSPVVRKIEAQEYFNEKELNPYLAVIEGGSLSSGVVLSTVVKPRVDASGGQPGIFDVEIRVEPVDGPRSTLLFDNKGNDRASTPFQATVAHSMPGVFDGLTDVNVALVRGAGQSRTVSFGARRPFGYNRHASCSFVEGEQTQHPGTTVFTVGYTAADCSMEWRFAPSERVRINPVLGWDQTRLDYHLSGTAEVRNTSNLSAGAAIQANGFFNGKLNWSGNWKAKRNHKDKSMLLGDVKHNGWIHSLASTLTLLPDDRTAYSWLVETQVSQTNSPPSGSSFSLGQAGRINSLRGGDFSGPKGFFSNVSATRRLGAPEARTTATLGYSVGGIDESNWAFDRDLSEASLGVSKAFSDAVSLSATGAVGLQKGLNRDRPDLPADRPKSFQVQLAIQF